jgi:hypothetical protein
MYSKCIGTHVSELGIAPETLSMINISNKTLNKVTTGGPYREFFHIALHACMDRDGWWAYINTVHMISYLTLVL